MTIAKVQFTDLEFIEVNSFSRTNFYELLSINSHSLHTVH